MKQALAFRLYDESKLWKPAEIAPHPAAKRWIVDQIVRRLAMEGRRIMEPVTVRPGDRERGKDWPTVAHTMIGLKRLDNLQHCVERVIADDVPGDLIETGVWRGGACILMRAVLKAWGVEDRTVWVADSFEGLPAPKEQYAADRGELFHTIDLLRVSLEEVQDNFRRYGLLDTQVQFLKGWFSDTLPAAPIRSLAVLRLDGDMYESTWDALTSLYPKLSPGGFCIVDDYWAVKGCRQAIHDFRDQHGISEEIVPIDDDGTYWRVDVNPFH